MNQLDKDGKNLFMYFAEKGYLEIIKSLLKDNEVNPRILSDKNKNALFYAIDNPEKKELVEVVKILSPICDVNVISQSGETSLLKAIERDFLKVVQILIENKADLNLQNSKTCILINN